MKKGKQRSFPLAWPVFVMAISFLLLIIQSIHAQGPVTGQVKDKEGNPVKGATVAVKNKKISVSSSEDGRFSIPANPGDILVISSIGYESNETKVIDNGSITVSLATRVEALEDLVVLAYGTVRKKDMTGSVSIVNVENAKKTASYDVAKLLQGQAAGVTVQGSGEPGGFVQIKIRGISTFGNNSPLFVVDGVALDAPFDFSPGDIESIQVLRDASSAALYGS